MFYVTLYLSLVAQDCVPTKVEMIACLIPKGASADLVTRMLGSPMGSSGTSKSIYYDYMFFEGVYVTFRAPLGNFKPPRVFRVAFHKPALDYLHSTLSLIRVNQFVGMGCSLVLDKPALSPPQRIEGGIE